MSEPDVNQQIQDTLKSILQQQEALALEKANIAKNDAEVVTAMQKAILAETRRAKALEGIMENAARQTPILIRLAEKNAMLVDLLTKFLQQTPLSEALVEYTERDFEFRNMILEGLKEIVKILYLFTIVLGHPDKIEHMDSVKNSLTSTMVNFEKMSFVDEVGPPRKRLKIYTNHLNALKEREARFGGLAPLDLLAQIEVVKEKIKEAEEEING